MTANTRRPSVSKCKTHQTKLVPGQLCEGCLKDELKANAPEFLLSQCNHEASGCDCGAPIHGGEWMEQWGLACKSCVRQALALAREEGRREGLEEAAKMRSALEAVHARVEEAGRGLPGKKTAEETAQQVAAIPVPSDVLLLCLDALKGGSGNEDR